MVGGGDDTGDRLGESLGTERREAGWRGGGEGGGGRDVGERVTGNEIAGAASQEKRRKTGSVRGWRRQRDRDG